MNIYQEVLDAKSRIEKHILKTPLYRSNYLSKLNNGNVYLKLENEQYTGSFKARGGMNKVLSVSKEQIEAGLITASTGNHAQGFARALSISGYNGTIYLPTIASTAKVEALKTYGVDLQFFGDNCLDTEMEAMRVSKERNATWVSPYNDPQIIGGQGTLALEILEQTDNKIDSVLACIGGGGMISGVASVFKNDSPETKIVGCMPENSPEMYWSIRDNKFHDAIGLDTISDGSAGGFEEGAMTFDLCKELIDDFVLTSEDEIKSAMKLIAEKHHKIIEGAAGVPVASFIKNIEEYRNQTVVIVICGANISMDKFKSIL